MSKVKKKRKAVGGRNVKAGKRPVARTSSKRGAAKVARGVEVAVRYTVKPLDPQKKCGLGTSVQLLYRVDERSVGKGCVTHLVFFDQHGWYCEHGRACPAVVPAKKESGQFARGSRGASH